MAKSRDKVQQHGFWDDEVKLPEHDDIVTWASDHALDLVRAVRPELFSGQWAREEFERNRGAALRGVELPLFDAFAARCLRPVPTVLSKVRELPLSIGMLDNNPRRYQRPVGFADLVLHVAYPVPAAIYANHFDREPSDFEVMTPRHPNLTLLVEVKSVLPTANDLIRQIRHYQTAAMWPAVVVAPDDKHAAVLAEQGMTFVQCPTDLSVRHPGPASGL